MPAPVSSTSVSANWKTTARTTAIPRGGGRTLRPPSLSIAFRLGRDERSAGMVPKSSALRMHRAAKYPRTV